jgi:hypothetical protein
MEEFVMHKKTNLAGIIILLAAALVLAACSTPSAPAAPTADANAVYTQAAATVAANLTQSAVKNPTSTATPEPPTATPTQSKPTATATVQQANTSKTTQTTTPLAGATQPTATKAGAALVPTATKAAGAPPTASGDKAIWVSQGPVDGATMPKSATFNVVYVLKNTGTTTWSKSYTFRYYAGDKLSSPTDLNLTKEVKPGDTVQILFYLIAPDSATKTHTVWVLTNDQGVNFYYVTMDLNIN